MLLDYKQEIISIASENKVDMELALNMFLSNVEQGEHCRDKCFFKGATADKLNYDVVKAEWNALTIEEKQQTRAAFLESFCEDETL